MKEEIGSRIKSSRGHQKMSISRLSKLAGVSKSVISQYENGGVQDPSVITLSKISEALKVSNSWLCFGSGMDHTQDEQELLEYFDLCNTLPIEEKRYILETLKRVITLHEVSTAVNSRSPVIKNYSIS